MIEENYPHFEKVKENEKNFNQYLENMMEFTVMSMRSYMKNYKD